MNPSFKVTVYLQVEYLKKVRFRDKVTKETNRKPYMIYRMVPLQWPWVTSDPDFNVTTFFDIEYLRNDTRYGHSYYRTSTGSRMHSIEWLYVQWPWRSPNPDFKFTAFLKSTISKRCILGIKLLKNTNRKPHPLYRMVICPMTLTEP